MSESHLRQMLLVGESAGKHIADYTSRFQAEFIALLSRRSVSLTLLRSDAVTYFYLRSQMGNEASPDQSGTSFILLRRSCQ